MEKIILRNSGLFGFLDFCVWTFGGKGVRRVKEKEVQPPLPSVTLATRCYLSVARQGSRRRD